MTEKGLNPGIVKVVEWLNDAGFQTVDSGDGKTHDFGCDRAMAYVVIKVLRTSCLIDEAERLVGLLRKEGITVCQVNPDEEYPYVEASYDLVEGTAVIQVIGLDDEMLEGKSGR